MAFLPSSPRVRTVSLAEAIALSNEGYPADIAGLDVYLANGTGGAIARGALVMLDQASTGVNASGEYTRVIAPTVAGNLATAGTYHFVAMEAVANSTAAIGRFRLYGDCELNLNASSATIGTLIYTRGTNQDATSAVTAGGKIIGKTKIATTTGVVRVWFDGRGVSAVPTLVGLKEETFTAKEIIIGPTTTPPAALAVVEASVNKNLISSVNFDKDNIEVAELLWVPPKSWDLGTITYRVGWSHAAATAFIAIFTLKGVAVSNDDTQDVAQGTGVDVTDTGGTTDDLYVTPTSTAVTIAGTPAIGDAVKLQISRKANDAGDTLDVDARIQYVTIFYTTNATTDD